MNDPFSIGPRLSGEFVGRDAELADAWSCIENVGDSLVIVSELPNGRTSLLRRIEAMLRERGRRVAFMDALRLPQDITPAALWHKLEGRLDLDLSRSYSDGLARPAPVFLLDDFHELLGRQQMRTPEFLGMLRSLASMRVLKFVSTSAADLVTLGRQLGEAWGSPFLNTYREQRLGPLGSRDVEYVLALAGDQLSDCDRAFIARCAGGQPKLLNLLASGHLRVNRAALPGTPAIVRHQQTLHLLRNELGHLFRGFWARLASDERWCLLQVCAGHACRSTVPGSELLDRPGDPALAFDHQRAAAVSRCFQSLPRVVLKRAVAEVLGEDAVPQLPSDMQTDAVFAVETESFLRRRLCVAAVLASLRRQGAVGDDELRALQGPGDSLAPPSTAAMESALERLADSGLLLPSVSPPGWEIRPCALTGWLRDHLRAPDLLSRLMIHGADGYSLAPLYTFVHAHRERFAGGAGEYFKDLYCDVSPS
ncbi:hypothetical protein [Nannocystis pusilla]|uniref:hypothetical protein n=1 Tax=Nannocystis pusilla TaxID=889268 RepID=UPI003BF42C86